jgi:peptide/histidine transporter 3/4
MEPRSPLTPQSLTPVITTGYSTKLSDTRTPKYSKNVMKKVCVFLLVVMFCEELAGYGVNQSLKNFFQRLGWSNKGSNSMKLTYDSLSQFACIPAGYISDEFLGKFKTLLGAASFSSAGFVLITIAALPTIRATQSLSKALFCIGLFLGIALNQVGIQALVVSFGGDQFSPDSPPEQRASYFSLTLWASNWGVSINYAVFPLLCLYGVGAIPADYGYVAVFTIGLVVMLSIIANLLSTRSRYVNVPPTKSALGGVIHVVVRSARHNFSAKMIVLGAILYLAAFGLNILAAFMSDDGEVGHNISYVCGVLIVVATVLWIYFAQDASMVDEATDSGMFISRVPQRRTSLSGGATTRLVAFDRAKYKPPQRTFHHAGVLLIRAAALHIS